MSKGQRFTFLAIAVVIAIVAVVVLAGSGGGEPAGSGDQAAATATPSATDEPQEASPQETATPTPKPPLLRAGKVTELKFTEGDTVRFRVRSDADEEIHVHAYDVQRAVPAGKTVSVAFKATITGIVEIEFHGSGEQIAELTVEPR